MTPDQPINTGRDSYVPVLGIHPDDEDDTVTMESEDTQSMIHYDPETDGEYTVMHTVDRITPGDSSPPTPSP